jgi:hypothetical protein
VITRTWTNPSFESRAAFVAVDHDGKVIDILPWENFDDISILVLVSPWGHSNSRSKDDQS